MNQEQKPADLVLSGGGVKFMGPVGAIARLMDAGYTAYRVSGVSAGSVVAVISAAGSQGDQLPAEQRYRVAITVADVTRAQLVRLPWDYRRVYGVDPDEQHVASAVRASMAIPFIYPPVSLTSTAGLTSTLVDGGVLSNFPVDSLDRIDAEPPRWPTFGITVMPKLAEGIEQAFPALRPLHFLQQSALLESLFTTMLVGHDQAHLSQPWVSARTIPVPPTDVSVLDFGIARSRLEELCDRGYAAAQAFLSTWDWAEYLERFRQFR